jgi:23S rRNA (cytidine2498-2'-O)-methyltransferase
MSHKDFTFIQGNALSWQPPKPVTWLLCDVITDPTKTALLIRTWVSNRWCKHFCVTMKFKGQPDFAAIRELCDFLQQQVAWFDVKQLLNNKNEVTWVGALNEF